MVSYRVGQKGLLFVEAEAFTTNVPLLLDDETYREFQNELVRNPERGVVMPGCGGLRKARVESPTQNKGRRGGCRVIYLSMPEIARIDLLAIFSKNVQETFTEPQRKQMKALAERAEREAKVHRGS